MKIIKQKWLKNTTLTIFLVLIISSVFLLSNWYINELNLTPIDVTSQKLYTISEESKEQIKNISDYVSIYFFGYNENNSIIVLAKQYSKINDKISVEAIDINKRPDLAQRYGIESKSDVGIIVESSNRSKVLTESDFITVDSSSFETIDITEQKLTNAILDTTIKEKPHIYFLTGHNEKDINTELMTLNVYLQNEIYYVESLDLLQQDFPEDCKVLVIAMPTKDFEEIETNKISEYINNGGNILWLDNPSIKDVDYPNIKKIKDYFGFNISKGMIAEQDNNKILLQNPFLILPDISYHNITKDLYLSSGIAFAGAGKINFESEEKLNELGLEVNNLLTSSAQSTYIEDFSTTSLDSVINSENGPFTVGAEIIKKINDNVNSKMIIFSNCNFITDSSTSENTQLKLINIYHNKDLVLNSIAHLTNREDTIRIRKNSGRVAYTVTKNQDKIIKIIIFIFPVLIVFIGIVVWQVRRTKNK